VSGPNELLRVIPSTLGFHPQDSLVLIALAKGTNGALRVGPIARVDLPPSPHTVPAQDLVQSIARHADAIIVVSYSDNAHALVAADYAYEIELAASATNLPIRDCIRTGNTPSQELQEITDALGRTALPSRSSLADTLLPATSPALPPTASLSTTEVLYALSAATPPTAQDAANIAAALRNSDLRDDVLNAATAAPRTYLPGMLSAARQLPAGAPGDANLSSVISVTAYAGGDGATAQLAADRALSADPDNILAQISIRAQAVALTPQAIRSASANASAARARTGRR
jgi:hypothetical protein